jgi:hypothetical protein
MRSQTGKWSVIRVRSLTGRNPNETASNQPSDSTLVSKVSDPPISLTHFQISDPVSGRGRRARRENKKITDYTDHTDHWSAKSRAFPPFQALAHLARVGAAPPIEHTMGRIMGEAKRRALAGMGNRPRDIEALLRKRGLSRRQLTAALMKRLETDPVPATQAICDLGFSKHEANEILMEICSVFAAAMDGRLQPVTAEAETAVIDARGALLDFFSRTGNE